MSAQQRSAPSRRAQTLGPGVARAAPDRAAMGADLPCSAIRPRRTNGKPLPVFGTTACVRCLVVAAAVIATALSAASTARAAPTCPLSYGTTDAAKSSKLYLYFPTAADSTFPSYATGASPAALFDVAGLTSGIGTTTALEDRIHDVVADDYCEFNVQVLQTTTNPATLPSPPPRRTTVAVGSDNTGGGAWGQAQEVDTGDSIAVDFARVWAGAYTACEGSAPNPMNPAATICTTGSLTGMSNTLDRWAQAIGGTAAHEGGHTYGLAHTDDDPPSDPFDSQPGPAALTGEDAFTRHLMPAGYFLSGENRASFRRHFSDRTFGLLATNAGLSVQTMHNWDLINPNATAARSLQIDFLSQLSSVTTSWSFAGSSSPWINPTVTSLSGTTTFHGTSYKRYRITWSTANPSWTGGVAGVVAGGGRFHIGTTFTGVDFNVPDPIVIQNITLLDASSSPLTLHPRLPIYDAGTVDSAGGTFDANFFAPFTGGQLLLRNVVVRQLTRVAAIDSLTGLGRPRTFDRRRIRPWETTKCVVKTLSAKRRSHCPIARLSAEPHVQVKHSLGQKGVVDCSRGAPKSVQSGAPGSDRPQAPDDEGPICAGTIRDPFPSTTIYITATVVDPKAKHFDRKRREYVVGPVTSKLYYQFAGRRHPRKR